MRTILFSNAVFFISLTACNNHSAKEITKGDTTGSNLLTDTSIGKKQASINELITVYLRLKNALVDDNGDEAAKAGKEMLAALQQEDEGAFTSAQKKIYNDLKDDIEENAEHISKNAGKIEHQREHFDWLSNSMYDLVKAFKPAQTLYKDRCLMFNESKGAIWVSEVKEIKNPYYGKKMLSCGVIKEEIK